MGSGSMRSRVVVVAGVGTMLLCLWGRGRPLGCSLRRAGSRRLAYRVSEADTCVDRLEGRRSRGGRAVVVEGMLGLWAVGRGQLSLGHSGEGSQRSFDVRYLAEKDLVLRLEREATWRACP